MRFSAKVKNSKDFHSVTLRTGDNERPLAIPPKSEGFGSSANGAELLFLALATCYCNDIYREALKLGVEVNNVEVEVSGDFMAEGEPAKNVKYRAKVTSSASKEEIEALMYATDRVAEIHNTLRVDTPVELEGIEAISG